MIFLGSRMAECWLPGLMRRAVLSGTFLMLIAVLVATWAFRFERVAGLPTWNLADLQSGWAPVAGVEWAGTADRPHLRILSEGKPLAVRLQIPGIPAVEGLHLNFRLSSQHLIPGSEDWQDGRFLVEWHHAGNERPPEEDGIGSAKYTIRGELENLVIMPSHGPAVPTLRLGHLGRSGGFELSELKITAVRERSLWKVGRWFLAIGWIAWWTAFIRSWPGISRWRAVSAAAIWVTMATQFVVPGPWKVQRPMVVDFHLGGTPAGDFTAPHSADPPATQAAPSSGPVVPLGKLPEQGSLVLRVKMAIARARPLLHALLLFGPALIFLFLLGRTPTLVLAGTLAVSIELAQVAFGYGFDVIDVGDLASDALGIVLALWLYGRIFEKR